MAPAHHTKILIIGSGPAGYTAAIYAARANFKPILIKGLQPGGQLTITTDVENFPGFAEPIQGPVLMERMRAQAEAVGAVMFDDIIVNADLSKRPFVLKGDGGAVYTGDTVIICTGASARWLGTESEKKFMGWGVSACATCDAFFFRGKKVAVIGGGDTAVEEAIYLTHHASEVILIHRRDELRASKLMQQRLFKNDKISVVWDSVPDEILGAEKPLNVTGIRIRNVKTGTLSEIAVDGVFIAIGHTPNTDLFKGQLDMDNDGYLITRPGSTVTNVPGVFAAGDVQDKLFRQAVTAAGTGCMSAIEAEHFLDS
ncbi:MAG: thioredoxin-disulfide reductase [Rhodospirillales bacterium RIFCSPLOWO2_12_FULL_58_28]|nr:MAG: thioredoxin-disulfide reductase [Rhodospirillales bacterium RIFCSPLOWO2_02_FULL_58_16]OHC76965.1 MAG: thioredoxin-disulfide reductase [Rhodospirillales bacterium RIFCSPLOWO2_12_FULL_58_28]